jgi:hypothetical protein
MIGVVIALVLLASSAKADDFEDGVAGYATALRLFQPLA